MQIRRLPGALGIGLLASLLAHAVSFGESHVQGGAFHAVFSWLGYAAILGFVMAGTVSAFGGAARCQSGSLLASRLSELVPGRAALLLSAIGWFVLGESLEPAHAPAPLALILAAILLVALALQAAARLLLRAIALVAVAIHSHRFAARRPRWVALQSQSALLPTAPHLRRRACRAPPAR
jgi:hypothetical protein